MGKQPLHEIAVGGVRPVGLDVDDDLVVLGPGEALLVVLAGDAEDLFVGVAFGLGGAVGGVDDGAAQFGREADRLLDVLHAEGRAFRSHQRKGGVDLGDPQSLLVQEPPQRAGVRLQRDGRFVSQAVDEILPVDHPELDVRQAVLDGRIDGRAGSCR